MKRLWEMKKHVDYDSFMREKIRFFLNDQGTHGHAHGHVCPAALFYLDSGMAMRVFLADLAWPCARPCLDVDFSG